MSWRAVAWLVAVILLIAQPAQARVRPLVTTTLGAGPVLAGDRVLYGQARSAWLPGYTGPVDDIRIFAARLAGKPRLLATAPSRVRGDAGPITNEVRLAGTDGIFAFSQLTTEPFGTDEDLRWKEHAVAFGAAPRALAACDAETALPAVAVHGRRLAYVTGCPPAPPVQMPAPTSAEVAVITLDSSAPERRLQVRNGSHLALAGRYLAFSLPGPPTTPATVAVHDLDAGAEIYRVAPTQRFRPWEFDDFDVQSDGTLALVGTAASCPDTAIAVATRARPIVRVVGCGVHPRIAAGRLLFVRRTRSQAMLELSDLAGRTRHVALLGAAHTTASDLDNTSLTWAVAGCRRDHVYRLAIARVGRDPAPRPAACPLSAPRRPSPRLTRDLRTIAFNLRCPRGCRGQLFLSVRRGRRIVASGGRTFLSDGLRPGTHRIGLRLAVDPAALGGIDRRRLRVEMDVTVIDPARQSGSVRRMLRLGAPRSG